MSDSARAAPRRVDVPATVLGISVRVTSDSPDVVAEFLGAFSRWGVRDGHPEPPADAGIDARIELEPDAPRDRLASPIGHRPEGPILHISGPGVDVTSDAAAGRIHGRVSPEVLADVTRFRREVLEAAVLWAIAHGPHDRQPVHAAAVAGDRAALLLTGPSGAGKSTLTYAAARAGLRVLSDESVFVQRRPLRVWGVPGVLRLTRASSRFFPELASLPARIDERGKERLEVSLAGLGAAVALPVVERVGVCVLERGDPGAPRWSKLSSEELERVLEDQLEEGFDLFRGRMGDLAHGFAMRGAWRLSVGERPESWAGALYDLLDHVAGA